MKLRVYEVRQYNDNLYLCGVRYKKEEKGYSKYWYELRANIKQVGLNKESFKSLPVDVEYSLVKGIGVKEVKINK